MQKQKQNGKEVMQGPTKLTTNRRQTQRKKLHENLVGGVKIYGVKIKFPPADIAVFLKLPCLFLLHFPFLK